jgi:helix-turn-helix protein
MPSIGDSLREARMRQRLDIADVEVKTKIRAKYLRALENEEFDRLPGGTFAKTFLRTYAEVLGLDPQLLVEEYRAHHEDPGETEIQPFAAPQPGGGGERRPTRRPPGRGAVIAAAVVALIAFLLVLGLTGGNEDNGTPATEGTTGTTGTTAKRRPRRPRPAPTPVTVRLAPPPDSAIQTCVYMDSGAGTKPVFQGIVDKPVTRRGKKFRIVLGNRSVRLVVNKKPVDLGTEVGPAAFEFSRPGRALRGKAVPVDAQPTCE